MFAIAAFVFLLVISFLAYGLFHRRREAEFAIGRKHRAEPRREIGTIFQIVKHRVIERGCCRIRGRRNRQSMDVLVHMARPLSWC